MKRFQQVVAEKLASLCSLLANRPGTVLVLGLIGALVCLAYTVMHLTFLPNFAGLNNQEISYSKNYDSFVKEFQIKPQILVVAKGPQAKDNKAFLERLAVSLNGNPDLAKIYFKVDLKPFHAWALAYPDLNTLHKIEYTLKLAKPVFESIHYSTDLTAFWEALPKMAGMHTNVQSQPGQIDDLRQIIDLMRDELQGKHAAENALASPLKGIESLEDTQYITLRGGTYALMFVEPAKDSKGEEKIEPAVDAIRKSIAGISSEFPNVEAHLTGEPVLGVDEMETAKHDIFWAGILSLFLSSAVLIIGFGSFRKTVLAVIALFVGISWSLGYITLSVKHLNVFTLSLFPMLIGLAIDFSIQFLGRYEEERSKGLSPPAAVEKTIFSTGSGLFAAALITSLGFLAISVTKYRGIAELGVATGGSLLLCFLSTMTILPALLIKNDQEPEHRKMPANFQFEFPKMASAENILLKHAGLIVIVSLLLTGFFAIYAKNIAFDHNVLNLQAKNTDSIKTEMDLLAASGKSSLFAVIVAPDVKTAYRETNALRELETVGAIQSPLDFLPQDQENKFPVLEQIKDETSEFRLEKPDAPVDIPRLQSAFEKIEGLIKLGRKKVMLASSALQLLQSFVFPGSEVIPHRSVATNLADMSLSLQELQTSASNFLFILSTAKPQIASGILTGVQNNLYETLNKAFNLIKNGVPTRQITLGDLPKEIKDQFIGVTGKIQIQVYPAQNIWNRPALERFIAEVRQVDPNVTGSPVLILETTREMLESYKAAAKIAIVVIVLVTFAQFRKLSLTLLALFPLASGLLWLMGIMVLSGRSFNPANLLTLPIILGIGVAFGVYVMNRYREQRQASIFSTSTGRSVLLSALTSIAGFASLLGVSHRGLQSLGFTMTLGLSAMTLQALIVLPAILQLIGNFSKRNETRVVGKPKQLSKLWPSS